jgi:hypothetical protein
MEKLEIRKGGRLVKTKWVYDEENKEGQYVGRDVTESAIRYLFDDCVLADDVTLRDVFLLLNTELKLFDIILGNWCEEIVNEGLTGPAQTERDSEIEYLELYWVPSRNKFDGKNRMEGTTFPWFHGVGYVLTEEKEYHPAGSRINYGMSFTPVYKLIDLPLKLKKETEVWTQDYDAGLRADSKLMDTEEWPMTLGHILQGIIWELSFHGGPESRDKLGAELLQSVESIRSGKAETIPFSDLLDDVLGERTRKKEVADAADSEQEGEKE